MPEPRYLKIWPQTNHPPELSRTPECRRELPICQIGRDRQPSSVDPKFGNVRVDDIRKKQSKNIGTHSSPDKGPYASQVDSQDDGNNQINQIRRNFVDKLFMK